MSDHASKSFAGCLLRIFFLAVLWVSAPASAKPGGDDGEILVFAASSLAPPLEQIASVYQELTGTTLRFSFASSAVLARQIEYGAPANIFITAHPLWLERLSERQRVHMAKARAIAGNRLVLARSGARSGARADQSAGRPTDFRALLLAGNGGRIATGDPHSVPLGLYARDSLVALGLWDAVGPRLAPAANARAALLQVERGLASLGILFASDAAGSDRVTVVAEMPAGSYGPIRYLAVPVTASPDGDAASNFLDFLTSAEATEIFVGHGFSRPE